MNGLWKLLDDGWWYLVVIGVPGGERVAAHFGGGVAALRRRHAGRIRHREQLRALELEAKRRTVDADQPPPVRPVCGCGHDLAFHNVNSNACHHPVGETSCTCQRYSGPEPLAQVYLPPLTDQGYGTS